MPRPPTPPETAPDVSVILPVRNGARFLAEAVESVMAQDSPARCEVIAVDDGSTDETAALLNSFPGVHLLRGGTPERGIGPAAARNRALAVARGAIVGFIDHDDLWPADKLTVQLARLAANPDLDIVLGRIRYECLDGRDTGNIRFKFEDDSLFHVHLGASLMRREVFDKIGMFAEDMRYAEDIDLFMRANEAGLVVEWGEELGLIYRQHASNMTKDLEIAELGIFDALRRSLRRRSEAGAPRDLLPILRRKA